MWYEDKYLDCSREIVFTLIECHARFQIPRIDSIYRPCNPTEILMDHRANLRFNDACVLRWSPTSYWLGFLLRQRPTRNVNFRERYVSHQMFEHSLPLQFPFSGMDNVRVIVAFIWYEAQIPQSVAK